jgi:hypothetical protein
MLGAEGRSGGKAVLVYPKYLSGRHAIWSMLDGVLPVLGRCSSRFSWKYKDRRRINEVATEFACPLGFSTYIEYKGSRQVAISSEAQTTIRVLRAIYILSVLDLLASSRCISSTAGRRADASHHVTPWFLRVIIG